MKPYLRKYILVFLDDIFIYSKTLEDHTDHLKITLKTLRENQLHAKLSKCEFDTNKIEYLGHIISQEGIATDPNQIEAITKWPISKKVKQLREFLGLTGYNSKFVRNYGIISKPLTDQLRNDAFFEKSEAQQAFDQLKNAMTEAPVLKLLWLKLMLTNMV